MTRFLTWEDTLLDYLRSSNEDKQVIKFVNTIILPQLSRTFDRIDWLELGPGPGTKTLPIAQSIIEQTKTRLRSLRLIEPSPNWCDVLHQNKSLLLSKGQLFAMRFEDYIHSDSKRQDQWQPNFVTCFHVLYEYELIEKFLVYLKCQEQNGCRLLACVIVESENSDFFKLRLKLKRYGQQQPIPAVVQLRNSILKLDLPVHECEVNSQYCPISDDEESVKWLLAFLLGCEKEMLRNLPEAVRTEASKMICHFLAEKPERALEVPDVAFTFMIG